MADDVKRVAILGGPTSQLASVVGLPRELMVDTDKKTLTVHDGEKAGGYPLLREDGDGSAVSVKAAGATLARTQAQRAGDAFNVKDFGAKGDGVTNDTAAIQAAIDAAEQRVGSANYWGNAYRTVYLPPGHYVASGLVISKRIAFVGDGTGSVTLRNISNTVTTSVITVNALPYDADNTAPIHLSSPLLRGFTIDGTGSAEYGIKMPDAPYTLATYGGVGANIENVNIVNTDSGALFIGDNRNAGRCTGCTFLYSNGDGIRNFAYDWIFVNCEVGGHNICLNARAGGSSDVHGCNLYYGVTRVVDMSQYVAGAYRFFGGAIEVAGQDVVSIDGGGLSTNAHGFYGVRFAHAGNGAASNSYSYLKLYNVKGLVVDGCFVSDSSANTVKPKYFIDADANCTNIIDRFVYDKSGAVWATDYTNNWSACSNGGVAFSGSTIIPKGPNPLTLASNGAQPVHVGNRSGGVFGGSVVLDPSTGYQLWELHNSYGDFVAGSAGSGKARLQPGGQDSLVAIPVAGAVNYVQTKGAASGSSASVSAQGADANISLTLLSKGTGVVTIGGLPGSESFRVGPVTNAVNWLQATGSASGGFVTLSATGADTDVGMRLSTKGNGAITFDPTGTRQFRVAGVTGATSWVEVAGSTAGTPQIAANAATGDATLTIIGKGSGGVRIEGVSGRLGFYGTTPQAKPTVTGSVGGNSALSSLLSALATLGLITNSTP